MTYKVTYDEPKTKEFWCDAKSEEAARCIFHSSKPERMKSKIIRVEKMGR